MLEMMSPGVGDWHCPAPVVVGSAEDKDGDEVEGESSHHCQ